MENIKRKDFGGALFLIFIGTILFLNTTGIVGWGIWTHMFRFWPVFIILGGLRLIFEGSLLTEIILTVISFIFLTIIGIYAYTSYTQNRISFLPENINNCLMGRCGGSIQNSGELKDDVVKISSEEFPTVESRNLSFNIAASSFTIIDEDVSDHLTLNANYDENLITPKISTTLVDKLLNIKFENESRNVGMMWTYKSPSFDFIIGKIAIPSDINIKLGAGEGTITLDQSNIKNVNAEVGAGQLTVNLPGNTLPEEVELKVGAGEINLSISKDVAFELSYDLGIGEIKLNNETIASFAGKDSTYKSSNYDTASKKIEIVAKVGVGTLNIKTN